MAIWRANVLQGEHVQFTCAKAKKILGLLYRQFYNHTPGNAMLQLYLCLVKPHLDYAASIWSPHMRQKHYQERSCDKITPRYLNVSTLSRGWPSSRRDVGGVDTALLREIVINLQLVLDQFPTLLMSSCSLTKSSRELMVQYSRTSSAYRVNLAPWQRLISERSLM